LYGQPAGYLAAGFSAQPVSDDQQMTAVPLVAKVDD
jgi:hypothetical protein